MDLKEADIIGPDPLGHWYYKSKAQAMARLIGPEHPSVILDVGAGSGFFSGYLLDTSSAREAWCVDTGYAEERDERRGSKPLHFRRGIESCPADLVLLMDVLEHVDDDLGLLRSYVERVPRGARFLISVPAFSFLWSDHDVFLEHRRRYRLGEVEELVLKAGLTAERAAYFFGSVFPLAAAIRLSQRVMPARNAPPRSQLVRHHPAVNAALAGLCRLELPLMRFNRLAGLSAFCLARKA